jgi:glycosyltransferase involved in cell wall biosynthesis
LLSFLAGFELILVNISMKICIIQKLLPFHSEGGAQFLGWRTALGLNRRGHDVTVITPSTANHRGKQLTEGVRVVFLDSVTPWCSNFHEAFAARAFDEYVRSQESEFDVVQVRGWRVAALVGSSCRITPLHIPVLGHTSGLGYFYEFETRAQTIYEEHNGNRVQKLKAMLTKKKNYLLYTLPKEREVRHLDAFTTVTLRGVRLARILYAMPKHKLFLINDGIPAERFSAPFSGTDSSKRILYVGALVRRKGVHILIRALPKVLSEHPDAGLRIVGDGPELESLRVLSHKIGVEDRISFVGRLPNEEIPGEMRASTVFVNPTISTVGYETVQIEAMMSGGVVVTPNTPSNRMILTHGETGFFFKQGSARSLARTIISALDLDQGSRERIGAKARHNALENFTVDKMAEMNEVVFQKLIAEARSSKIL